MRKNCLFMIMFAEGVQKGKIPPCRIGYLISVSNRDTNKSRVPNTFWTPSYKISRIIVKRLWFAKSSYKDILRRTNLLGLV